MKTTSRSERRRSLPAPGVAQPPDISAKPALPELPRLSLSARSLYERRRTSGVTSPTLTLSGARSLYAASEVSRSRSIAGGDEVFSIHRLRSNSGLSLHTNSAALRRYTDYNADGSTRLPPTDELRDSNGQYGDALSDSRTITSPGISSTPTAPGPFSWETVRAVLDDPVARQRLWEYSRVHGGAENLEFLDRVGIRMSSDQSEATSPLTHASYQAEQYNKALHNVTALMATISTKFTSMTATEPLNLPPHLAKSLNGDVKHVSSSILPGLEMLFGDVDVYIKDRIVRQIYPDFAKRQLMQRMKASLGAASAGAARSPFAFGGLGSAFCLTDPYRPDNPIVYATENFAHVMGYSRTEDIPRNIRFFRGLDQVDNEAFTEELVLSRNIRENRLFWSLVTMYPLKTSNSRVRFLLCGMVDITDAIKTTDDLLLALSIPTSPFASSSSLGRYGVSTASGDDIGGPFDTTSATRSYAAKFEKATPRSFFNNPFSRRRRTEVGTAGLPRMVDRVSPRLFSSADAALRPPRSSSQQNGLTLPNLQTCPCPVLDDKHSVYSRYMVLQFVPWSSHGPEPAPPTRPALPRRGSRFGNSPAAPIPQASSAVSRLKVAFTSLPMLELLGLGPAAAEAVLYHDIFAVLSELAGSPSITPVFRASVRQRIVTSESASLEICVPANGTAAPGVFSGGLGAGLASPMTSSVGDGGNEPATSHFARRSSVLLGGRAKQNQQDEDTGSSDWDSKPSEGWWSGASGSRRRRSGTFERPPTGERKGSGPGKMQRLMSHWTPLKDIGGSVAWVMLVMSPVVDL